MKKEVKSSSISVITGIRYTLDEKMDSTPSKSALHKLALANEALSRSKYKTIEEMIKHANDSSHK